MPRTSHWNILHLFWSEGQHMRSWGTAEMIRQTVPLLLGALGTARARHATSDGGERDWRGYSGVRAGAGLLSCTAETASALAKSWNTTHTRTPLSHSIILTLLLWSKTLLIFFLTCSLHSFHEISDTYCTINFTFSFSPTFLFSLFCFLAVGLQ